MTDGESRQKALPRKSSAQSRQERLAAELRANLVKRKRRSRDAETAPDEKSGRSD